jgi:hypothetical protein
MLGAAIVTKVTGDTTITAISGGRIYPEYVRMSDKRYPLCVYKIEQVTPLLSNSGPTGLESAEIVIACIANTYKQAAQLSAVVQASLDGSLGASWGTTIVMQGCFLKDDGISDSVVTDPETEQILYYVKELSFQCSYVVIS